MIAGLKKEGRDAKPSMANYTKIKALEVYGQNACRYVDSLAIYLATVKENTEEDHVLDAAQLSEYYEGVIKGILAATNGNLISKKKSRSTA